MCDTFFNEILDEVNINLFGEAEGEGVVGNVVLSTTLYKL